MAKSKTLPIALSIAGSDSGGGAGIQADLKTFAALGVHGVTAITCLTAQNPRAVRQVEPCSTKMLSSQLEAIFAELPPVAVKTGMLYSAQLIRTVTRFLSRNRPPALVVDPVMVATSGASLMEAPAIGALLELLPLATLVTPNLDEAGVLMGQRIRSLAAVRKAARQLHGRFGCAVLVKGGHLPRMRRAVDVLFDGEHETLLEAPFIRGVTTHGTGCSYSAAVAAWLARGVPLGAAVRGAKRYITRAIRESRQVAGHTVLHF